jgi:hypothetical protein
MIPADRKTQPLTSDATKLATTTAAEAQGRPGRRNRGRDLNKALRLRPKDIFALFGIPDSTLCVLCKNPDKSKRPPSVLVPGRKGHRGIRLAEQPNSNQTCAYLWQRVSPVASTISVDSA